LQNELDILRDVSIRLEQSGISYIVGHAVNDTSPEVERMVREQLMARSGAERFRMGVEMFEAARRMVLASFPTDLSPGERKRRLYERIYGEPLPFKVLRGLE
jgi:hypothetical protein